MITLDEAFEAAVQLLEQRGQLLNAHLFRLVESNDELFRQVRTRLIAEGIAEDRSGAGLARTKSELPTRNLILDSQFESDWWLMASGVVQGPLRFAELREMRDQGRIQPADVVRHAADGLWQRPDDIPQLAKTNREKLDPQAVARQLRELRISRNQAQATRTRVSGDADFSTNSSADLLDVPDQSNQYALPEKNWSLGNQGRPNLFARTWRIASTAVGGSRRLTEILLVLVAVGGLIYWWQQPPASEVIYEEFTKCHIAVKKLQDRRVSRNEWLTVTDRYRQRINKLVGSLQSRASSRYPIQNSLYLAGKQGLLPMLDNPVPVAGSEQAYEQHITMARKLMDNKKSPASKP